MMAIHIGRVSRRIFVRMLLGMMLSLLLLPLKVEAAISVPSVNYYASFRPFHDGDYLTAFKAFRRAARGGVRNAFTKWIDSICYHAMMGECQYQMGNLAPALEQYEAALKLFLTHADWLTRIQFPPVVQISTSSIRGTITWGPAARPTKMGHFPDTYPSFQGRLDTDRVIQQGGVFATAKLVPVGVHEIVRCTALALRRRLELLGPAAPHDPLSQQLYNALATRPGPPNHWSRAWVSVQLGLAQASLGQVDEAIAELQSALFIAGEFDHPLTATAQIELGKLALRNNRVAEAAALFLDATVTAAEFQQPSVVGEAFGHALAIHLAANPQAPFLQLGAAAQWARQQRVQQLFASLLLQAAENQAVGRKATLAQGLLDRARQAIGRQEMMAGRVGARYQYLLALVQSMQGNTAAANAALANLASFQHKASIRLFQVAAVDRLYGSQMISGREADGLYEYVLRDANEFDWRFDPIESLSVSLADLSEPLLHWFQMAAEDRELPQRAVEISERIRRHRFYRSLQIGGRLLGLRWVLEAPPNRLGELAQQQRNELRLKYADYEPLSAGASALRAELAAMPLVPSDPDSIEHQRGLLAELDAVSRKQEAILQEIALHREPVELAFPRLNSMKSIQEALAEDELILVFQEAQPSIHAFMLSRNNYASWRLPSSAKLKGMISLLLRALGNSDPHRALPVKAINSDAWEAASSKLLGTIIEERQHGFWNRFRRITIVPDGILWHVPFESMRLPDDSTVALGDKVVVRYLPFASMIVPDGIMNERFGNSAVVLGKLYPSDEPGSAEEAYAALAPSLPEPSRITSIHGSTGVARCVWNRLVVLDEIRAYGAQPYQWSPAQLDGKKPGGQLERWLYLPWGGPQLIVLPGFQTDAAGGVNRLGGLGDPFLATCGLMAAGARTVVLGRWRTGGRTTIDLLDHLLRELPNKTGAEAWQAARLAVHDQLVDPANEPRLPRDVKELKASHPFFSGSLLVVDISQRPDEAPPEVEDTN